MLNLRSRTKKNYQYSIDTIIEKATSENLGEPGPEEPEPEEPGDPGLPETCDENYYKCLLEEDFFVYGSKFVFNGSQVNGAKATMLIKGDLSGSQINGGALNNVSNIYIDGNVTMDGGSAGLGSISSSGMLCINGNLSLVSGGRNIYGEVFVNGNAILKDATFHQQLSILKNGELIGGTFKDDVYIGNNLSIKDAQIHKNMDIHQNAKIDWTPSISDVSLINYMGTLSHPRNMSSNILSKFQKVAALPAVKGCKIPSFTMPSVKSNTWYAEKSYNQTVKPNNMKLFGKNITITPYKDANHKYISSFENAIIVATGDINIGDDRWIEKMTGVLFAPNGKVTFNGALFEGLVIAKDGFYVTSGGTTVNFRNISHFIKAEKDFPLQ
ncbi:hypothetical protein [Cytobacillus purgationiresistens]|uniref:Polymer-forming cytoskeletal protein n=1 Tax=Cytobacillus purgationiresistens TaxID=863449 RepID=A0ABU0AFG9_9BACI|nr:hypothetical protein [Cytobacillus purgationiresistens]MDQ0269995.1 hypothetical protein [Cytobacillus purgationiresistens]